MNAPINPLDMSYVQGRLSVDQYLDLQRKERNLTLLNRSSYACVGLCLFLMLYMGWQELFR